MKNQSVNCNYATVSNFYYSSYRSRTNGNKLSMERWKSKRLGQMDLAWRESRQNSVASMVADAVEYGAENAGRLMCTRSK